MEIQSKQYEQFVIYSLALASSFEHKLSHKTVALFAPRPEHST